MRFSGQAVTLTELYIPNKTVVRICILCICLTGVEAPIMWLTTCGSIGACYCRCSTLASLFLQISQSILTTNWYFWIQASLMGMKFLGYIYTETLKWDRPEWLILQVNYQSKINASQGYDKGKHLSNGKLFLISGTEHSYVSKGVTNYIFIHIFW